MNPSRSKLISNPLARLVAKVVVTPKVSSSSLSLFYICLFLSILTIGTLQLGVCYLNSFASLLETNFTKNTHPQSSNMPMVAPSSMMHKCDKMGSAPTSDVARRNNARAMPLPARWCHVQFFFFFFSICSDLCQLRPNQFVSTEIVETHRFKLYRRQTG